MTSTEKVYAINIQPRQIAELIGCKPDDTEAIAQERRLFYRYLLTKKHSGIEYTSQNDGWNSYRVTSIVADIDDKFKKLDEIVEHRNFDSSDGEEQTLFWLADIHKALWRLASAYNYDERKGQQ